MKRRRKNKTNGKLCCPFEWLGIKKSELELLCGSKYATKKKESVGVGL